MFGHRWTLDSHNTDVLASLFAAASNIVIQGHSFSIFASSPPINNIGPSKPLASFLQQVRPHAKA